MEQPRLDIEVTLDDRRLRRFLRAAPHDQVPFAAALALTNTAKHAQGEVQEAMRRNLTLRSTWAVRGIRVQRAEKRDGLRRMAALVGSRDWFMADQLDEHSNIRRPRQAKYRWQPVGVRTDKGRKIPKRKRPNAILEEKGVYTIRQGRNLLVLQRKGRGRRQRISLLYYGTPDQNLDPAISLHDIARATAKRKLPVEFARAMKRAIRTSR